MKSLRSAVATGIAVTAMFASTAGAQYAPMPGASAPEGPSKADLIADINKAADIIQAGTNNYCKAEYDGDKSKGEHTNADVAALVRGMAAIPDKHPSIKLEAVHSIAVGVAQNDFTVCFDKRVKDLGAANVPEHGQKFMQTHGVYGVHYFADTTMSFTPVPVDAKDPTATSTALLTSFHRLATGSGRFQEAAQAAQMLSMMGHPQAPEAVAQAQFFASKPFLFLYNPASPEEAVSGPAKDADHLMKNMVIRTEQDLAPPPAPTGNTSRQPTGLRI